MTGQCLFQVREIHVIVDMIPFEESFSTQQGRDIRFSGLRERPFYADLDLIDADIFSDICYI